MHCERHRFTGLTRDGGFADYVLVDERSLVPLPAGTEPADVAPHSDAGITAYHAVKKLVPRLGPGTTVAVIGVGGVGHIALQLIRVLGAGDGDRDRHRRAAPQLARELGARRGARRAGRRRRRRARGDERRRRRRRPRLRRHGRDARGGLRMLARRGLYSVVGYGGTVTAPRWRSSPTRRRSRATSSAAGSISGSSSSCMRAARSPCAPRPTRSSR